MSGDRDPRPGRRAGDEEPGEGSRKEMRCDFCGEVAARVRRVALDEDYDRLARPHRVLYACGPCSDRKERERVGQG